MSKCEQYQEWFVESLYNELATVRKEQLDLHLKSCGECAQEYQKLSATLKIMDRREREEPSPEFWAKFDQRLQDRLSTASQASPAPSVKYHSFAKISGTWWKAAAAVLLVGIGIIIGRYYSARPVAGPEQMTSKDPVIAVPTQHAALDPETKRFLERSEMLLVGLVNLDTESEGAYAPELTAQKKYSQDLIHEAAVLKTKLKGSDQARLRRLVSDLELILLQIANLEEESDLPEIELVKSGVDRKGVLLKINLEQMRMSGTAQPPEQEKAAGKKRL